MSYLKSVLSTVKKSSPILYWITIIHFILAVGAIAGIFVDDRTLMGINIWVKPLKFGISTGIFILTVGYIITLYPFSTRKKNIVNNLISWSLILETAIIFAQGARGVQSHYNVNTAFDGILFAAMGLLIAISVLVMLFFIIETIRLKLTVSKSIQWAILLGWIVVFFGSWVGGQMISQMGHNVGVVDGGAGLPLVNWSTIGGDLRIAHFFGLHGIQIIPLFALALSKKWKTSNTNLVIGVTIFGLLYAGWIAFTFYQAEQGMALITL